MRLFWGKPVMSVDYVLGYDAAGLDAERHDRAVASPIALHCVAVDVATAAAVDLTGMRSKRELWDAILASSRMPWAGGAPIELGGRRYVDGGLAAPIPVAEAVAAGATHVLALQTRPYGVPRKSASRLADRFIERHLRQLNPALVTLYRERVAHYETTVEEIARRSNDAGDGPPYVLGLRPPAGTPVVSQIERRSEILARAAADAEGLVERALG
jgi:predicted patatin/cPLA2 family phospholipase